MQLLWEWKGALTEGRNVSSMTWNKKQHDLVAVGYGSFEFGEQQDGLVCLWSLKNPKYPLWSFKTESGVTALDFSAASGGVLAVGMYDGNVAVYDVRTQLPEAAIVSDGSTGKHSDPVWKVKWIDKESEVGSTMVSISTDGRVTRWKITKGLEHTDLMKLKRMARRNAVPMNTKMANIARNLKQEAFISRLTAGTAFDFSLHDDRIYIAATEDGWIHKCSTSYSEQYLESYQGHMGPVYNVQWCPYQQNLFISCSADWTVRLWKQEKSAPLLTFQSGNEAVHDVQWCPNNSTVFATATSGGRLEVWDFAISTLRPVAANTLPGSDRTCVLFNEHAPIIIVGDSSGSVSVFRLFEIEKRLPEAEQQRRLAEAMDANVMKTEPGQGEVS